MGTNRRRVIAGETTPAIHECMTPRRSVQPVGLITFTALDDVIAYLRHRRRNTRAVYVTDNPFLSRIPQASRVLSYQRFLDAVADVDSLDTISLQRAFITDEFISELCKYWLDGKFPNLSQLNLNYNLISDDGFVTLAECVAELPTSSPPLKLWAVSQLRPTTSASDEAMLNALRKNPRIVQMNINWRKGSCADEANDIINERQTHFNAGLDNLKSALLEIQSQTPNLKVFRLADNPALSNIMSHAGSDADEEEPFDIMPTLSLLAKNTHLNTLELPGNGLDTVFVNFFFNSVVDDGAFRSVRHLNLENNRFNISDISAIVSLVDVHHAFAGEANPCALIPFESLRLSGQEGMTDTDEIEMNRDSILSKFIYNQSLTDLTLDISENAMQELRLYLERNEKKGRCRVSVCCINQIGSPSASQIRRQSSMVKFSGSADKENILASPTPKARFLFSPQSPMEKQSSNVDTIDDVMAMVARESPLIEDFTIANSGFLCCLHHTDAIKFTRGLISLLAYNVQLHTIALTNCGVRDSFVDALISSREAENFPNLYVLDFTRNSLSDDGVIRLLESPLFHLKVIRLRHRSNSCSVYTGTLVLSCLKKQHRGQLRVFEFDFDNAALQERADIIIKKLALK